MQSTIYYLQQQLRQTREQLAAVQKENELLRDIASSSSSGGGGGSSSSSGSSQQNKVADSHGQHYDQATSDNLINQSCSSASPSATDRKQSAEESVGLVLVDNRHGERDGHSLVSSQGCTGNDLVEQYNGCAAAPRRR